MLNTFSFYYSTSCNSPKWNEMGERDVYLLVVQFHTSLFFKASFWDGFSAGNIAKNLKIGPLGAISIPGYEQKQLILSQVRGMRTEKFHKFAKIPQQLIFPYRLDPLVDENCSYNCHSLTVVSSPTPHTWITSDDNTVRWIKNWACVQEPEGSSGARSVGVILPSPHTCK